MLSCIGRSRLGEPLLPLCQIALSSGVDKVITSELFQVPTTAALFGRRLAVVNAKFDTGIPPTAKQFEVVLVDR